MFLFLQAISNTQGQRSQITNSIVHCCSFPVIESNRFLFLSSSVTTQNCVCFPIFFTSCPFIGKSGLTQSPSNKVLWWGLLPFYATEPVILASNSFQAKYLNPETMGFLVSDWGKTIWEKECRLKNRFCT